MDESTQPVGTQDVYDPRRMGRNNSGLNNSDIADVLCILHPCTPAAFRIVSYTAERSPQYVLQNHSFDDYQDSYSQENVEEAETFIIGSDSPHAMDLALRFSAKLMRPELGFVFGRNPASCDLVFDGDTSKRISNMHYRIFINPSGVLMLEDASTNGTVVDEVVLKGKGPGRENRPYPARMLLSGSIIQILSPKAEEVVKFIVRIPNREGHEQRYQQNFHAFMTKVRAAETEHLRHQASDGHPVRRLFPPAAQISNNSIRAPMSSAHFGMHWSGGEKYSVVGNIGKGAFATVYQIATKTDGQLFAAKELDKRRCMKNGVLDRKVTNEMQIMQSVNHPNIVQYMEYKDVENYLYIIMEFVPGGDLQQYLANHGALPEPVAKRMAAQVLDALDYLHRNKITHRDIKPDNILLANLDPENFSIKLSDFGLSKVVADDKETFLKTFCGTLLYCAPEVFPDYDAHVAGQGTKKRPRRGQGQSKHFHSYSQSVDIWSFAAVLWYSLCMSPPFEGVADATGKGMFQKIMGTSLDPAALIKAGVSDDAISMLVEMLNTDPSIRPTPALCLQHKWFGGEYSLKRPDNTALGIIREEHEAEAPDVASLRIDEHRSQDSQLSIDSADIKFFDPRQSKRFKSAVFDYRDQGAAIDSSPEIIFDKLPIVDQGDATAGAQRQATARKLFGEISINAGSGNSQKPSPATNEITIGYNSAEQAQAQQNNDVKLQAPTEQYSAGAEASPSLLGAESLVREMKMSSPNGSGSSPAHDPDEPTTPGTPSRGKNASVPNERDEITPRPAQTSTFNRQINIQFPPSLFWDSNDPSTHTTEYASKVSGLDFSRHPSVAFPANENNSGSATDKDEADHDHTNNTAEIKTLPATAPASAPDSQFVKPKPRLGKLISTADSFAQINLTLTRQREEWGRAPSNSQTYPDGLDTRVPKRALIVWFHANGIEDFAADDDGWIKLPDLQAFLMTEKRGGVVVNGVVLPKSVEEYNYAGRVYTGDEIEVYSREGEAPLKFVCEFFHGIGRESRPHSVPAFVVERHRKKLAQHEKEK